MLCCSCVALLGPTSKMGGVCCDDIVDGTISSVSVSFNGSATLLPARLVAVDSSVRSGGCSSPSIDLSGNSEDALVLRERVPSAAIEL